MVACTMYCLVEKLVIDDLGLDGCDEDEYEYNEDEFVMFIVKNIVLLIESLCKQQCRIIVI